MAHQIDPDFSKNDDHCDSVQDLLQDMDRGAAHVRKLEINKHSRLQSLQQLAMCSFLLNENDSSTNGTLFDCSVDLRMECGKDTYVSVSVTSLLPTTLVGYWQLISHLIPRETQPGDTTCEVRTNCCPLNNGWKPKEVVSVYLPVEKRDLLVGCDVCIQLSLDVGPSDPNTRMYPALNMTIANESVDILNAIVSERSGYSVRLSEFSLEQSITALSSTKGYVTTGN